MILKINKTIIAYIILFVICLQSMGIAFLGNIFVALFMPVIGFFLLWKLISDKFFINNIIFLIKNSPFIYFCLFYLWSIFTVIVAMSKGLFYFNSFLTGFIGGLTFSVLLVFLTTYILLKENYIDLRNIIKFFALFYLFVFILGLINYVGSEFNIDVINNLLVLFNNKRAILSDKGSDFIILGKRIQSVFDEPGAFGEYIYVQLPIIFAICCSKYKIFDNIFLNFSIKKFLIPLAFINLILTKSPMSLILTFLVAIIYFYKFIIKYLKKYFFHIIIGVLIVLTIILVILSSINLKDTYLNRIIVSLPNLFHLKALIVVEPSLATRIINYIIMMQEGMKNFVFGIGYGTLATHFWVFLQNTTLPLTLELSKKAIACVGQPASAIFYRVFCETGLPGLILLLIFYFKTMFKLSKIKILQIGLEKDFLYGLFISLLFQSTLALFYNSNIHNTFNVILYAIALYLITNKNIIYYREGDLVQKEKFL